MFFDKYIITNDPINVITIVIDIIAYIIFSIVLTNCSTGVNNNIIAVT